LESTNLNEFTVKKKTQAFLIIPSPTKLQRDIVTLPSVLPSVRPSVTSLWIL